jgi:hypothetical protein
MFHDAFALARFAFLLSVSLGFTTLASGQTLGLTEIARFDLSLTANPAGNAFIGGNPIGLAYNGSKLYVAGLNSGTTTANVSIVEVTNPTATGLNVTPTYSAPFGPISTVGSASRGYTGLAIKGSKLSASYDSGTNTPTAFQMFDASTNSKLWDLANSGTNTANIGTTRGFGGPDFDPGFNADPAQGSGLAWTTQNQGRRFLNESSSGAAIYTTTAGTPAGAVQGMIINIVPNSTTWRDIAFNPATGDMYTRVNNSVSATLRTGSNTNISLTGTAGQSTVIVALTAANAVGTNLGFMNGVTTSLYNSYAGNALIFNDRTSSAAGQAWTSIIKFATTTGTTITPTWTFLDAGPATGNAIYDFGWDPATQTLAVSDYTNRTVSLFSTAVPEPSTYAVMAGAFAVIGVVASRKRKIAA